MAHIPEKIPREAGNLNDGQSYERKLLLFIAAYLSQNDEVDNFWIVSNPTGIDKIDDIVARVSFKNSEKKDIAVFIQTKLTSPDKLLWLNVNKKKPTQKCYEIKLIEYEKAFNDVIQVMTSNKPESEELRKLLKGVDIKDYFACIFTNMEKVEPKLLCKQFDGSNPIDFLDTRNSGQYRQFDVENEKFNSNFYKQLYVFVGQPNFVDIDSSIAQLLGEDYKHRLANLDEIVKDFMQRNKLCWVLTRPAFEISWLKVLIMEWLYINLENIEEINPKFERLWQNILTDQTVINLRSDKIWPLLAYHYQCVIIKEVDENFEWQKGITQSTKNSIKQKYSENLSDIKELLFLLWRERKLSLAIRSDFTRHILDFLDKFKTMTGGFVVFSSEDHPEVINDIKQISESVELLKEAMSVKVSLQGRPPVPLSDIGEWQTFSELKIAQVLAWTNNLEDGRQHIVGPVLTRPDQNYIARTFTRKQYDQQREILLQDQEHNDYEVIYQSSNDNNYVTPFALKQGEEDDYLPKQQREILTVEDVIKLTVPALHIITGEAGMGKSTVLKELAHKHSSKNFAVYVILRDCLEDIECDDTWPSIEVDPIQYFFNKMTGSDDAISESIFHNHKQCKRLCLFLDGFDEILPLHGNKLFSLIASILTNTAIPIFCTTRPHGAEQITKCRNTICLDLSPFGSKQITQYLKKIKIKADNIKEFFDDNFLSNPLHLNMISQIYEKTGNRKHITRGKMYKLFIDLKHIKSNQKMGLSQSHARLQTNKSLKHHRLLALVDIFGRECVTSNGLISDTELNEILDDICEHNIGIVHVSTTQGKCRFHHRTFAEYLVADWLLQMANQDISINAHFNYIYEKVIRNHRNICSMINELSNYFVLWSEASRQLHINSDLFKQDEFGRCVTHAAISREEQEKFEKSVYKSRLFYRKDLVLQWTCREFFHMKPYENSSAVVDEINKDYPTRTPLAVSKLFRAFGPFASKDLNDRCTNLLTAIDSENTDKIKSILISKLSILTSKPMSKPSLLKTGLGIVAFHSVITTGNENIVKLLLDLRPELLNEQDCNGNTALHIACAFGYRDIAVLLLTKHADVYLANEEKKSPLEMAAAEGQLDIVSLLLDHIRGRMDIDGRYSSTALYNKHLYQETVTIAWTNRRWDVVTWLIEQGADPTISNNDDGWSVMHFAALEGQLKLLTLLLKMGLNINAKTNTGVTPLYIAIVHNHLDTSKWLLEHGADPTLTDDMGCAAMHIAAGAGQVEILTLLLESGLNVNAKANKGETPLSFAIRNNRLDSTKWLLEHGADPTLSDEDGWTAMHYATRKGQLDMLELLLQRGLNVDVKTNIGETLLAIAVSSKHVDTVEWLLGQGADPTLSDENGWAPMHYAAATGQLKILKLLSERGLNVNSKSNTGETPLTISFDNEQWGSVKWLLEHGGDHTVSRDDGWSAMHYAATAGNLEILELLSDRGLNVNAKSNAGQTPLTISIDNDHWNIVKWLLEHGADHRLSRDDGWACIHFAAKRGQLEILKILLDRGVNVNAETNMGETPHTIAINYKNMYIAKCLLEHGANPALTDDDGWSFISPLREDNWKFS